MRIKRTLFSTIIFLIVFSLSVLIDIPEPILMKGHYSKANETYHTNQYNKASKKLRTNKRKHHLLISNNVSTKAKSINTSVKSSGNENKNSKASVKIKKTATIETLYSHIGISIADSFVNIRKKASIDSEIEGKLYRNSVAEIIEKVNDWYYIESGSVKGYVKSALIKTDIPGKELINRYGLQRISVKADGLNVRAKPDTNSKALTTLYENETYTVISSKDHWVKVDIEDDKVIGYVKKEFVDTIIDFKKAVSITEELELQKIIKKPINTTETTILHGNKMTYCNSDIMLLACLVHAEAGGQTYEGKLAVANIVLNRVKSGKFPKTIRAVIYSPRQFSVARSGSLAKQLANYNHYSSRQQLLSIKAAKAALEGVNNIGSRLYFHSYRAAIRKGYDKKPTSVRVDDQLFW